MASKEDATAEGSVQKSFSVSSKAYRKFYESIVLYEGLNEIFKTNPNRRTVEAPFHPNSDPEHIFHEFVNKLGHVCDSRPRGSTVTSFVVLQEPDTVRYVFASNRRSTVQLKTVKAYISSLLTVLRDASLENDEGQEATSSLILTEILWFNIPRIKRYLANLNQRLAECIDICIQEESTEAVSLKKILEDLKKVVDPTTQETTEEDEFVELTMSAMKGIEKMQRSTANIFIQKRASASEAHNTKPWRELRHHSGRLLSYQQAVEVLLISRLIWPQLFHDFEVDYLESSNRDSNPLKLNPLPAETIVSRLLSIFSVEERSKYKRLAESLPQKDKLDELIKETWTCSTFRPFLHSEVLLMSWLEQNGGTGASRFFRNWAYIGSSKPTCRLCQGYFAFHPSDVTIRSGHGNLYLDWRFPDDQDVAGISVDDAIRQRHDIIQKMTNRIGHEVARMVKEKVSLCKTHDSFTMSFAKQIQIGEGGEDLNTGSPSPRMKDSAYGEGWTDAEEDGDEDGTSGCRVYEDD